MDAAVGEEPPATENLHHPPILQENESWLLVIAINAIFSFLATYGWLIVIVAGVLWYFNESIRSKLNARQQRLEDAEYHKNPDKFIARECSMQDARSTMQEKYDALAKEHEEKRLEKEEQKRLENIEKREKLLRGESVKHRSTESTATADQSTVKKTKTPLRPSFNPMFGGMSGYTPPRRGNARGG